MAGMGLQRQHTVQIIPPPPPAPLFDVPNRPSPWFFEMNKFHYLNIGLPLYRAAVTGDWQAAKEILLYCPQAVNMSITRHYETALHIAASTRHIQLVAELVNMMKPNDLELQKQNGYTALCVAAEVGIVEVAIIMLTKNENLLKLRGDYHSSPLIIAAMLGHKDMVSYLYSTTNHMNSQEWSANDRIMVLYYCVNNKLYDVALQILDHHKTEVAQARDYNALHILATKPSEFDGTSKLFFWKRKNKIEKEQALKIVRIIWSEVVTLKDADIWNITYGPPTIDKVRKSNRPAAESVDIFTGHHSGLLFVAAKMGNTKFIVEILRLYPELAWKLDNYNRTIFHIAVSCRQESVYSLLYEMGSIKYQLSALKDLDENNILHLAAMKPEQNQLKNISGVGLQMQRELQWFKEVQSMVLPTIREAKNKQGKTPQDLFTEQHAALVLKGEGWMKHTASQCMLVATLIATIMFAAAFTLPGGNNGNNGQPIFLGKSVFVVFVIADAISLFTSSISIVIFLAILTARYKEEDFLKSLPMKLMFGLLTLLIAIATMMGAFSASFFLVYQRGRRWVTVVVTSLAVVPVTIFVLLQSRLFYDVFRSTSSSMFLFKAKKRCFTRD